MKIQSKSDYFGAILFVIPLFFSVFTYLKFNFYLIAFLIFIFSILSIMLLLREISTAEFLDETIIIKKPFFNKNKLIIIPYSNLESAMYVCPGRGKDHIKLFYEYEGKKCKTECYFKKRVRFDVLRYLNYKNVPIEFSKGIDKDDIRMIWKEIKQGTVL